MNTPHRQAHNAGAISCSCFSCVIAPACAAEDAVHHPKQHTALKLPLPQLATQAQLHRLQPQQGRLPHEYAAPAPSPCACAHSTSPGRHRWPGLLASHAGYLPSHSCKDTTSTCMSAIKSHPLVDNISPAQVFAMLMIMHHVATVRSHELTNAILHPPEVCTDSFT